jgi:exodeoxyribonuclease V beta subunit
MTEVLDLKGPLPQGRLVIEASAGTGKTYSLIALVARHVAERKLAPSSLLVVTFTRAAAAELRDRTRRVLVQALDALRTGAVPDDQGWMEVLLHPDPDEHGRRRTALETAVSSFDDATITTIHGFCQQALRQLGFRSSTPIDGELGDSSAALIDEVCRDLLVTALATSPAALNGAKDHTPGRLLSQLIESVGAVMGNPGAVLVPDFAAETVKPGSNDTAARLEAWVGLVHTAVHEVGRRRAARGELGYDDLVVGLRDAVCHPVTGPAVVKALAERYQLVLVDEFQDTDPVQWQIFETAFTQHLVTVGDPKQAIYRFRGADVHAYLAAVEGAPMVHLTTNFRSDAHLVKATNTLIDGVELGDERIVGIEVQAAQGAAKRATDAAPLQIRCLEFHPSMLTAKDRSNWLGGGLADEPALSAPLARAAIIDDLVNQVVELLELETLTVEDVPHKVHPGHIAVLVPSGAVADQVLRALSRAGVPAVRTRTGSVLDTPAALEWRLLLGALERPSHAGSVRGAGLGAFLRASAADLDPMSPDSARRVAVLQQRCAQWADDMTNRPFLAWYDSVRAQSDLVATLLGRPSGERDLTDFDHIAELVAAELGAGRGTTPSAALRVLDRLQSQEAAQADDPQMRRIDSDAQAVQITTLHSSKGLEYPIVMLPAPFHVPQSRGPRVYNDDTGRRVIDIAKQRNWQGSSFESHPKMREYYERVGTRGDLLRLLYVGLTRGEHRTVVWWAPVSDAKKSAINVVLFDRDHDGRPANTRPEALEGPRGGPNTSLAEIPSPPTADVLPSLEPLVQRAGGAIEAVQFAVGAVRSYWAPIVDDSSLPDLMVAPTDGRTVADPAWRRWSFSSITAGRPDDWMHQAPVHGGADEPEEPEDPEASEGANEPHPAQQPASPQPAAAQGAGGGTPMLAVPMPLVSVKGGTAFGTMVHSVLERIDPTSASLEADVRAAVQTELRSDRLDLVVDDVVAGLCQAIHTPLGEVMGGLRLADIPVTDRLAELDFDLPLHSEQQRRVTAVHIGEALLATLPAHDPQRPYAQLLADGRYGFDIAGFLRGSIDAVFRVPGPDGQPRFVVVDYKTNRLHQPGAANPMAAYHPHQLPAAMAHSDYPLQALLYSVAVHRYLHWRLPGYDPAVHLGGIGYLFVRGMVGEHTPVHEGCPYGVFQWRPPAATVLALDELFAGGAK